MGTRIPLYPYLASEVELGGKSLEERRNILQKFTTYIDRREVQVLGESLAFAKGFDPNTESWVHKLTFESECHSRRELAGLIDHVGRERCIVVPTLGDIIGYRSLKTIEQLERAVSIGVQIIVVDSKSLGFSLVRFDDKPDQSVFECIWRNAMAVNDRLVRRLKNAPRMKDAARKDEFFD